MAKTIEEKAKLATKKIKELSKRNKALQHLVKVRSDTIDKLEGDLMISKAQIQSASMFIAYMSSQIPVNTEGEVRIDINDLYAYAEGYKTAWRKDEETRTIIIKTTIKNKS